MSIVSAASKKNTSIVRVVFEFYPIVGGSVTHIIELAQHIDAYLNRQTIIAPYFGDSSGFDNNLGIDVKRVRYPSLKKISRIPVLPFNYLFYSINLFFMLKKLERPYIIHAHGISNISFCVIIGKLLNIPVIGMLHGSLSAYSNISGSYERILAMLFKPNHAFILDDGSKAPLIFRKYWENRVTIVYHGINSEVFKPKIKNKKLLKNLKLNNSHFIILSTSSLTSVKKIDLLLISYKIFLDKSKLNNASLLIVGEGNQKDELMELAKNLHIDQNVMFLGAVSLSLIPEYLSISDIVVATSLYSNMNRSVQEAMSCEIPVVAFDSGNTNKLIKHMNNGILVRSGDLESFAEYLYLLYNSPNLRQKIGINARETILTERSWEKRIDQELSVYNKINSSHNIS